MVSVVELPEFIKKAEKLFGYSEKEELIYFLSLNPTSGTLLHGTGGIRKLRWATKGKGKSGGARVIYFYYNETIPLFLLSAFEKSEKDNITKSERNL